MYDQLPWLWILQWCTDIADLDFIQHITSVLNKIAPLKEIRIKNYSHDWLDGEILDKIILRDNRLKKFKASRLNIDEQLCKEAEINVQKLIKNKNERLVGKKIKGKCRYTQGAMESP